MSRSVNKITLIGNVGRDPDIQQTKNGTKVAHFSIATNRRAPAGSRRGGRDHADPRQLPLRQDRVQARR